MAVTNEERIENLKNQLMAANLTQAEIDRIEQKIKILQSLGT